LSAGTGSKAYQLAFEQRPEYLYARVDSKAASIERVSQYLSEIMERCHADKCKRLLIDRHIPNPLPNVDVYRAIIEISEHVPEGLRIAMVDTNSNDRKRLDFGSRAARAQQLDAGVFGTVEEAEKWLLRP
jgi:hypothetical protein